MQLSPACSLYCTSTANHHLFCPFLRRLEGEEEAIADEPEAKKFKEQVCVVYHACALVPVCLTLVLSAYTVSQTTVHVCIWVGVIHVNICC